MMVANTKEDETYVVWYKSSPKDFHIHSVHRTPESAYNCKNYQPTMDACFEDCDFFVQKVDLEDWNHY